jgi:membrane-associated protein
MEFLAQVFGFFLHLDEHLLEVVQTYGTLSYAILFAVVFLETGFVVTPFLPGDSLLFAAGALAAAGALEIQWVLLVLCAAPMLGDSANYWIGRVVGPRVFTGQSRFFKQEHLIRTQRFYERHGGKTIVLARFAPILRTFAPFVAGIAKMNYARFVTFSVAGSLLWVPGFVGLGYFFGNIPIVKENFSLAILAIILVSLIPMAVEAWKARKEDPAREGDPA